MGGKKKKVEDAKPKIPFELLQKMSTLPKLVMPKPGTDIKLESLLPPRDYSLSKPNSYNFFYSHRIEPNLNVTRNKKTRGKYTKKEPAAGGRGRGRGRGAGAGAPSRGKRGGRGATSTITRTVGIFSEGVGPVKKLKSCLKNSTTADAREPSTSHASRKFKRKKYLGVPRVISQGFHPGDNYKDVESSDNDDYPVRIRKRLKVKASSRKDPAKVVAEDDGTKKDSTETTTKLRSDSPTEEGGGVNRFTFTPTNLTEFFDSKEGQLFVLQLPFLMPCEGNESFINEGPKQDPISKLTFLKKFWEHAPVDINQVPQGLIGKVVRYKSGKTKFFLGETPFDVDLGIVNPICQELMSVKTNPPQRSGTVISLGPIPSKLVLHPNWEFYEERVQAEKLAKSQLEEEERRRVQRNLQQLQEDEDE